MLYERRETVGFLFVETCTTTLQHHFSSPFGILCEGALLYDGATENLPPALFTC